MSLTYTQFVNDLAEALAITLPAPNFTAFLPMIIDDAEQRIYRDLDLLATIVTDTAAFTANNRNFTLPTNLGTFVVVDRINVITPSSQTNPDLGARNALRPMSAMLLDFLWPSSTGAAVPLYFAMKTQAAIIVGPWPDQNYTVEVAGTQRPAPLSAANATTFLSVNLPDLFFAAGMVYGSAYQKNFGAQADDPRMAMSWEQTYQQRLKSAATEEARKKFAAQGWASRQSAQAVGAG